MNKQNNTLGDRMKGYEEISKTRLVKRMPVIVRIDGKAFHTFTRGFNKPFDNMLTKTMQETTKYLCEHIQGCVFGYTQSDEITLVLVDYKELNTTPWFDNEVQKICSVSASMATYIFNTIWNAKFTKYYENYLKAWNIKPEDEKLLNAYQRATNMGAMFDARCFNIPKEEVTNNIIWRQQDATRNSIQMLGRSQFSHKELQGKSCNDIQEMLMTEKNINWNDCTIPQKRGTAILKNDAGNWYIDENMPIITQDRDYIEKLINFE